MFIEFEAQSKPQLITYDLSLQQVTLRNWTFFFPSSFSFYTRQSAPIPRYPSIIRTANKRSATIVPRVISQRHGHEWLVVGTEAVFIASDRCTNNAVTLHNWSRGRWKPRGFSSSRVKTSASAFILQATRTKNWFIDLTFRLLLRLSSLLSINNRATDWKGWCRRNRFELINFLCKKINVFLFLLQFHPMKLDLKYLELSKEKFFSIK